MTRFGFEGCIGTASDLMTDPAHEGSLLSVGMEVHRMTGADCRKYDEGEREPSTEAARRQVDGVMVDINRR